MNKGMQQCLNAANIWRTMFASVSVVHLKKSALTAESKKSKMAPAPSIINLKCTVCIFSETQLNASMHNV